MGSCASSEEEKASRKNDDVNVAGQRPLLSATKYDALIAFSFPTTPMTDPLCSPEGSSALILSTFTSSLLAAATIPGDGVESAALLACASALSVLSDTMESDNSLSRTMSGELNVRETSVAAVPAAAAAREDSWSEAPSSRNACEVSGGAVMLHLGSPNFLSTATSRHSGEWVPGGAPVRPQHNSSRSLGSAAFDQQSSAQSGTTTHGSLRSDDPDRNQPLPHCVATPRSGSTTKIGSLPSAASTAGSAASTKDVQFYQLPDDSIACVLQDEENTS